MGSKAGPGRGGTSHSSPDSLGKYFPEESLASFNDDDFNKYSRSPPAQELIGALPGIGPSGSVEVGDDEVV